MYPHTTYSLDCISTSTNCNPQSPQAPTDIQYCQDYQEQYDQVDQDNQGVWLCSAMFRHVP